MTNRFLRLIPLLLAVSALTACTAPDESPSPTPSEIPTASGTPTASETPAYSIGVAGLHAPWSVAFHGTTALVSERDSARILELDGAGGAREVAVIDGVAPAGEGGLLGHHRSRRSSVHLLHGRRREPHRPLRPERRARLAEPRRS